MTSGMLVIGNTQYTVAYSTNNCRGLPCDVCGDADSVGCLLTTGCRLKGMELD